MGSMSSKSSKGSISLRSSGSSMGSKSSKSPKGSIKLNEFESENQN